MGALAFTDDMVVNGSSFGESDGTEHDIVVLEGNGHLILRVQLAGSKEPTDLLFTSEQLVEFADGIEGVRSRLKHIIAEDLKQRPR